VCDVNPIYLIAAVLQLWRAIINVSTFDTHICYQHFLYNQRYISYSWGPGTIITEIKT